MNISLIGPRGSGKTKVSFHLARLLKFPILCIDALISYEENGKTIPQIIEEHNGTWQHFRDTEFSVLKKSLKMDNTIVDCGGGIVIDLDENNSEIYSQRKVSLLRKNSIIFFLHPPIETVVRKIVGDPTRPSLDAVRSAENIYHDRLPLYRKACHYEIHVKKGARKKAALAIHSLLIENG